MPRHLSSLRRGAAAVALSLIPALGVGLPSDAVTAGDADRVAPDRVVGRWVTFRTNDSGAPPAPRHSRQCERRLGPVLGPQPLIELEADLYSFRTSRRSGLVTDETARRVAPGYLCTSAPDPTQAPETDVQTSTSSEGYAQLNLPELGLIRARGVCELIPSPAQPGALFFNCRLSLLKDPARGIVGGLVTSNSVLNPGQVPGNGTGSIWTAYVERRGLPADQAPPLATEPVPGRLAGDVTGQRVTFLSARARTADAADQQCAGVAERVRLTRSQARLGSSVIPARDRGRRVGLLDVCAPAGVGQTFQATATLRSAGPDGRVDISSEGTCRTRGRPGHLVRACTLVLAPDAVNGVQGGLITTIGPIGSPRAGIVPRRSAVTAAMLPLTLGSDARS